MSLPWVSTEEWWWGWRWPWDPGWSAEPLPPRPGPAAGVVGPRVVQPVGVLGQLGMCQGRCPGAGVVQARGTCLLAGCPWICRGCQAGWAYDSQGRHVGPVKWPHSNRWDCNRVKWLGWPLVVGVRDVREG